MIVRDVTHHATAFYAQDPTPLSSNPYPKLFGKQIPSEVLAGFPWNRFQVVRDAPVYRGPVLTLYSAMSATFIAGKWQFESMLARLPPHRS